MAITTPHVFGGKVMHARLFPRENKFTYGIYYLACPLSKIKDMARGLFMTVNRFGLLAFYDRDHGKRTNTDLESWIKPILIQNNLADATHTITLVTMPRVLGYVFNPVSFWLCSDSDGALKAVLCEVNNTFGETHSYLCARPDRQAIRPDEWLEGEKLFHVSPFLERMGTYRFKFNVQDKAMGFYIDFYNEEGKKQLVTTLTGTLEPYSTKVLFRQFLKNPLVTLTAVWRIHWQAVKLVWKGIKYIPKPKQKDIKFSTAENLTKN